ncbi:hypothetical protein Q2K19_02820 [Micromonospora soli]|uniref:hypothetical protein n=1 Tax=Micromonospora sp. NBRC 110009 TaxID=3061627 RepID=UPI002673E89A|nr:hypothetical protein [Micromonospora sp. NBRC 110009]WKT99454.1 hypothetical protein Q2K19_02820 [Micromonospora sp. NBRC 110009]
MAWPPKLRRKWHPVAAVLVSALAGWALLALLMSEASLDRADKAASVISMLIGLGALVVAVVEVPRRLAAGEQAEPAGERPTVWKRPSVLLALGTMAVGLLLVVLVGVIGGGEPEATPPAAAPTTAAEPPSPSPAASGATPTKRERCASAVDASPAAAAASPSGTASSEVVRHDGPLVLSKGFNADLDSLCPDWDVTDLAGSRQDIGNDGTGLGRNIMSGTQIAVVQGKAPGTYAMCSANTDYVSETLGYDDLAVGDRYCVLTDAGRRSLLTVKRVDHDGDRTAVYVQVRTWAQKPPDEKTDYGPWILGGIILLVLFGGGAKKVSDAAKED